MSINKITLNDLESFREIVSQRNALDQYNNIATKSAIYPGNGTPLGLAYVALKMNGEAGEFAEHVGKAMRDDDLLPLIFADVAVNRTEKVAYLDAKLFEKRRELLIKEIGDVLWYLSAACNELGIALSDAALGNLEKLYDRTQRDVLRGSGDNR